MHLFQKILKHLFLRRALETKKIAAGLYFLGERNELNCNKVLIDLSNPLYSHLGDHLFYQPLLHHLLQSGINAKISPSPAMKGYFQYFYGETVLMTPDSPQVDGSLTIQPFWDYRTQKNPQRNLLLVNLSDTKISQPVSAWLVSRVSELLGIHTAKNVDIAPYIKEKLSTHDIPACLPSNGDIAIFNNYIDSGKFRINPNHQKRLAACAHRLKSDGMTIVHVGSSQDLQRDLRQYDFIDTDVRGKITPLELMAYFHQPQVKCSVTFDNFIMHASLLANRLSHVRFRGRYTHAARLHHYQHVNQAFTHVTERSLIRYI